MRQSDFRSACIGLSVVTDSSTTFFHEQAYTEYQYVQVIFTIARGKSLFIIYHQSFHWVCLKCWITCATVGLEMKYFYCLLWSAKFANITLSNAACEPLHIFTLSIYHKIDGYANHGGASTMQIGFQLGCRSPIAVCFAGSDKTPTDHFATYKQNWHLQ